METGESSSGYYCHKCDVTVSVPLTNLCPRCNDGFIEKLPSSSAASSSFSDQSGERNENSNSIPTVFNRVFNDFNNFGFIIRGDEPGAGHAGDNRPSASNRRENPSDGSQSNDRRRPRNQNYPRSLENVLHEFLSTMTRPTDGNSPVFFLSNPGDYAWGREGLDTIVTQLLNQMDSSGPPPLAKDKIKELPYVSITEKQASENIQCSVCWDSFKTSENVRQLPCEHIYHDICIVPWLELHGTCPICRKLLCEDGDARLGFTHSGGLEALLRDVNQQSLLQNSYPSGNRRENRGRRSNIQCHRCRQFGHIARDCHRQRANDADPWLEQGPQGEAAFMLPSLIHDGQLLDGEEDMLEFEDYGSDFTDSQSETCDMCFMRLDSHMPDCPLTDDADFSEWDNGWETTVSFSGSSGSTAYPSRSSTATNVPRKPRSSTRCYNCNQLGHIARHCQSSSSKCMYCSKTNHKSENCRFARSEGESKYLDRLRGAPDNARAVDSNSSTFNPPRSILKKRNENSTYGYDRNRAGGYSGPSTSRSQAGSHRGDRRSNVTCYCCHLVGHIARECPTRRSAPANRRGATGSRSCPQCGCAHHPGAQCEYNFF